MAARRASVHAVSELRALFDRGNFAAVRARAQAVRARADATLDERAEADDYLRRIAPPTAATFALWVTLALVTFLSTYFILRGRR